MEFGSAAADFTVDQTAPADIQGLTPNGSRERIVKKGSGPIRFAWTASSDNGPTAPTYEVEVSMDTPFLNIVMVVPSAGPSEEIALAPNTNNQRYAWRVRAVDGAGNCSAWSPKLTFDVYYDDGKDNGAGDATKICGFGAPGGPAAAPAILLAAVFAAAALRRRI